MIKKFLVCLIFLLTLSSCSAFSSNNNENNSTPVPVIPISETVNNVFSGNNDKTYDPCAKDNINQEVILYSNNLISFDQVTAIALASAKSDLINVILDLQHKRENVAAIKAPVCLKTLQKNQLTFMNGVIITLTHFMAGGTSEQIQSEIAATRILRSAYEEEMARLLGIPYVTATPAPTSTPLPTSTPTPITATTKDDIYTTLGPGLNYQSNGTFLRGQTVNVAARSEKNDWIKIELFGITGQYGWVPATMVIINGTIDNLPIETN